MPSVVIPVKLNARGGYFAHNQVLGIWFSGPIVPFGDIIEWGYMYFHNAGIISHEYVEQYRKIVLIMLRF